MRPIAIAGILFVLGALEGLATAWHPSKLVTVLLALGYGLVTAALVLWGSANVRTVSVPRGTVPAIVAGAFVAALVVAYVVLGAFPLSGDEFGYSYLADTLLHGRLWNASFPRALQDVLATSYIPDIDGRRLSQYAPGWPAVLAAFTAFGAAGLANPALGLAYAGLLVLALRRLGVAGAPACAVLAIALLAPFAVYNDASFYNHTLTIVCLMAVVALDLDASRSHPAWSQAGIGFAFSVLLITRYEVFAVAIVLYLVDGLLRHRLVFVIRSWPAAATAAPLVAFLAYYDWRVTGNATITTMAWASPAFSFGLHGVGIEGVNSPAKAAERVGRFVTWWAEFVGFAIVPLAVVIVWRRLQSRTLRWFDLMLPGLMLFFVFFPDGGGFQYGPRYWFAGWAMLPVTLAAGISRNDDWSLAKRRFQPVQFAALQVATYLGFSLGYAFFAHVQSETRQLILREAATAPPSSIVLIPSQPLRYVRWQWRAIDTDSRDFTRNGADGLGAVALARDLGPMRTALLCTQFRDRIIFRIRLDGSPPAASLQRAC